MTTVQEGAIVLTVMGSILMRALTGHTPLRYLAVIMLMLEALVQQLLKSLWIAAEDYRLSFPATFRQVKSDISHKQTFNVVLIKKENEG